jgi:SpoIID/LytB domain protein
VPVPDPRATRRGAPARWAPVALAALLLAAFAAAPGPVEAASRPMVPACSGVNLRTGASTSTATRTRLATGTTVTVVGTVNGSEWSTICAGSRSGSIWYRISHVKGKTVRSLYGVTYLYAAKGVLKPAPTASAPTPTPPPTTTQSASPDAYGAELMRLVNLDRAALGLPPFAVDAGLLAIARDAPFTCPTNPALVLRGRATDMADRTYFGHTVAGCYLAGTTTPYPALEIVRNVFGYAQARSEILHWNTYGSAATTYQLGCNISGGSCAGGTTTTPYTVALAQRSFMSSSPHRTSQLASYQRFGCGSATVPGTTKTYFACLFSNSGSTWSPSPTPTPLPTPMPTPSPAPDPAATPTPSPALDPAVAPAAQAMVPACSGANLRTGPTTSAAVKATLGTSASLTVVATVAGSSWSTDCAGPKSGSTWYQVSHVNGQPVDALYGVAALYAATGVLTVAPSAVPAAAVPAAAGPTALGATVTFYGRGWGHGVGLSQYGARGRALAGQDAATILAHYYPGTAIGFVTPDAAIRVLLLDDIVPTAASPLTVLGRGSPWTIDGVGAVFPADARLRLIPSASGAVTTWRLVVDDAGAVLLDAAAPADLRIRGADPATTFQVPAAAATHNLYRGTLRVILAGARADVVNELPLQDYLRGVVPAEMPSSWPEAARTAQAIAARSYAAYRLRPGVSTFDVYDDTRSQVYLGTRVESAAADAVIAATAGQVLVSGTGIANTLFHSTGGGATEHNENVYVSSTGAKVAAPLSYLRGSSDRDPSGVSYDATSPYATWQTKTYTLAQLSAIFAADARTNVGVLQALDLRNRGVSGRLISVTLIGSAGSKTVSGGVFTNAFNAKRPSGDPSARSTLLDLAPVP